MRVVRLISKVFGNQAGELFPADRRRVLVMGAAVVLGWCLPGLAAPPTTAPSWTLDASLAHSPLNKRLYDMGRRYFEINFDPDANLVGSSSKHPPNKKQHSVRESAAYALGLLMTDDPADHARAQAILRKVLAAQDTQANSPTCGEFKWYAEDPVPQDSNSAAFDGVTLAGIIDMDRKRPMLDPELRQQVEQAGKLAVQAVLRRNVDAGYTNIALLSTGLAAAGEKLWAVPGAGKFAQEKLEAVLSMAKNGSIYEYLAPTYMAVDLSGAYTARKYAFSDAFAADAKAMIDELWKEIASAYHAPTYQLAGPNCRSYGENMLAYAAGLKYWIYLALDGDYPIADSEADHAWDIGGNVGFGGADLEPRPEFKLPVPAWRQITVVGPNDGAHPTRHLFQYREGNLMLGTIDWQDEWLQKRNLVAFWRTDVPAPEKFRVGFCYDESNESLPKGFPYAQVHFYSKQVKSAALVALVASTAVPGKGGCELVFDKDAKLGAENASPLRIQDGSVTAYLYPVSNGAASFKPEPDPHTYRLMRSWNTADFVGDLHVLAYLVVFRPSDQAPPAVSGLQLRAGNDGVSAGAKVDGADLSLSFKQ